MAKKYAFECYDCGNIFKDSYIYYEGGCKVCDSMNYNLLLRYDEDENYER
jgi:predicted DCC family thiol-disulfide oxidoreductase YuxK